MTDVVRRIGPAARQERAVARLEAVRSNWHVGRKRPLEHLLLARQLVRHSRKKSGHGGGHVLGGEQVADIGMPEVLVEVQHLCGCDVEAGRGGDPRLHRDVGHVLVLERRRRFHFGDPVARADLLEHIDRDVSAFRDERRLEDDARAGAERLLGGFDAGGHVAVRQIDQHSVGVARARDFAHLTALIEQVLQHLVGLQLLRLGLVHGPPEQLVALDARDEAGLGEAARAAHGDG